MESIKVLITQDCRDGSPATGKTAIYEGDFPRTVGISNDGGRTIVQECMYEEFIQSTSSKPSVNKKVKSTSIWKLWDGVGEPPSQRVAIIYTNPRMTLDDGTYIWGDECWWTEAEKDGVPVDMENSIRELERQKSAIRTVIELAKKIKNDIDRAMEEK